MQRKSRHWADEKEAVSSSRPIKFVLLLLKILPAWLVNCFIPLVAFFFYIFNRRGRCESVRYQRQLHQFTEGRSPKKISSFKQILSFANSIMEKLEGWLGKIKEDQIITHQDDEKEFFETLNSGHGVMVIMSHLGNIELLRSLTSYRRAGFSREVSITVIMENSTAQQFNNTLNSINDKVSMNVIDSKNIGPDTIELLQQKIDEGGIIVIAGDRTPVTARNRVIKHSFLGEQADFPYGAYFVASLLKVPTYFVFSLRTKITAIKPVNNIYIEKSHVNFDCPRKEREARINELCDEFVQKLEKYCEMFPYHWYNFYNFWLH